MSDNEEVVERPKKVRSKAQQVATENMLKVIKAKREALAKEKETAAKVKQVPVQKKKEAAVTAVTAVATVTVKPKVKQEILQEQEQEQPSYVTHSEFASFLDMVGRKKEKPPSLRQPKKTRKVIVEESESDSDSESEEEVKVLKIKVPSKKSHKKREPVYRDPIDQKQQYYEPPPPPPRLSSGSYVLDRLLGRS